MYNKKSSNKKHQKRSPFGKKMTKNKKIKLTLNNKSSNNKSLNIKKSKFSKSNQWKSLCILILWRESSSVSTQSHLKQK